MAQDGNAQIHYFDHFGFEEEEEEDTSSDEDDQERHVDAQITVVSTHSDLSSVTSMESDNHSNVSSTVPTADNNVVIVDATTDASTTDETPLRFNSQHRSSPTEMQKKKKKSDRISEREFQTQIRSLLTVLMEANGTSAQDNLVHLLDGDGMMDAASCSSYSTASSTQPTELDLGMQAAIEVLQRSTNNKDETNSIPSPQQVVESLIKSLDTEAEDNSPATNLQQQQQQRHYYLQALPSGESSGFSAMYDDPMTWHSTSILSSPDKDDTMLPERPPKDEDSTHKQQQDNLQQQQQQQHIVDDDTALKLYALLKDFDMELENVQLEQELSRSSASGTAVSDSSRQPQFVSATSTTTVTTHDRMDDDDGIRQPEMISSRSLSSDESKNSSTPQIPHPPLLRRTSSTRSMASVPFPPLSIEEEERDAAAAARKVSYEEQLSKNDNDIHGPTEIVSAFVIQNNLNNNLNRNFNNIPTPLRSNVTGPRTALPRPERLEDSDEEISVYSYGSKSSLKLWGKKKKHKKTGSSDMVSVSSPKSSKSKLFSRKKEPKVRLLAAADDDLEEHGVWKDPFAPSEETTFTVVEAICESGSGEGDSPQSRIACSKTHTDFTSSTNSDKSMAVPYTSDTYLPGINKNQKLSWGELEVAGDALSFSSGVGASSSTVSQGKKNPSSSSTTNKPPTLIDSDGFLFTPDAAFEEPISPFFNAFYSSEDHNQNSFWTKDANYERPQEVSSTTAATSTATAAVDQVFLSTKERIEKLRAIIEEKSKVDPEGAKTLKIQLDKIEANAMSRISKVRQAQQESTEIK